MNGHRTYTGINTPRYAIKPTDVQGYQHKARLSGPIESGGAGHKITPAIAATLLLAVAIIIVLNGLAIMGVML
jgi:hypothetical protein